MLAEKTNFTITRMVRLLSVSRSGYYAWIDRAPSPAAIRRVHIEQKVAFFHGDSDEVYGPPRILADPLRVRVGRSSPTRLSPRP